MRRSGGLVLALGLVVLSGVLVAVPGAIAADAGPGEATAPESALAQPNIDADTIEMEATVHADGTADWRVIYRLELGDESEREAFEELQAEIEEEPATYLEPFEERMERTAGEGQTATAREMTVEGFAVTAEHSTQPDTEFGTVTFTFEWHGFATAEDDGATVHAGDALDRLFLDEETTLTLKWDEEYELEAHTPEADTVEDDEVAWRGPLEFDLGEPRIVLTSGGAGAGILPATPLLLSGVAVAALVVGLWVLIRQRGIPEGDGEPDPGESSPRPPPAESDPEPDGDDGPPLELLSNEERVLALLEENDGRIKQKEVAETLDWSAAKTSQVVGTLREEGQLETFRIGRENVLTLPDVDIVPDQDE